MNITKHASYASIVLTSSGSEGIFSAQINQAPLACILVFTTDKQKGFEKLKKFHQKHGTVTLTTF